MAGCILLRLRLLVDLHGTHTLLIGQGCTACLITRPSGATPSSSLASSLASSLEEEGGGGGGT
eukprot:CAMPEP_0185796938 /NCGR_PEP_ID=MMETSP1174-20130828/161347_1 /TAXON_ID=35687 /ORGANISM="Dictyocha speculum, Strain CCMP1381" /LENGTH=62 /DNA_ID=CAMNT_0028492331 /DNA_START=232 /DNA_END=420 /DNA_ORIENTATION=-